MSRETTLSRDLRDPEELEAILCLLTARVAAQLREEGLVGRTVTLKLRHDDFHTVTRRHTLETATDLDAELFRRPGRCSGQRSRRCSAGTGACA